MYVSCYRVVSERDVECFLRILNITRNQVASVELTLSFFNNLFFCPWKIEHQRTTHKEQMTKFHLLKNRQKYNETHSHLAVTGSKWQSKGDTVTKSAKANYSSHLKFSIWKLSLALSNELFHNIYNSPQKKRERTEYTSKG